MTRAEVEALNSLSVHELRSRAKLPFRLLPDIPALLEDMAHAIVDEIRSANLAGRPARLILPVGPTAQYAQVAEISNQERVSWRNAYVFAMDEFLDWQARPIAIEHPLSFEGFLRRELFAKLDENLRIPEAHCFFPHPFRTDAIGEAINGIGGIDACFGGIGYHGHVAFNEPPFSRWFDISVEELRRSVTRVVALGDDSIVVQSINSAGGNSASIPPMAVTLGMSEILASRKIRLYCAGGARHRAVFRRTVAGEVSTSYPSTLVQAHADAEVITDEATAAPIRVGLL